jgi:sugar phosphate isomerase/epimerase
MPTPAISVQLYTIHKNIAEDLDGSLGRLAEIGFRNVEAFNFPPRVDEYKAAFEKYGLSAPTAHAVLIETDVDTPDKLLSVPTPEATFEAARTLGIQTVIDPFVPPAKWQSRDDVLRSADVLNERSELAKQYGLTVGYHNHDHELRSVIDGQTALELFASRLAPEVILEVDLYWATASRQEPIALLQRLGDRVTAVHVKDGPMREGIVAAEGLPTDQCPAGTGDVPLKEALAAGTAIKYAVVEYDHYEGDTFEGIAASYRFLVETLGSAA